MQATNIASSLFVRSQRVILPVGYEGLSLFLLDGSIYFAVSSWFKPEVLPSFNSAMEVLQVMADVNFSSLKAVNPSKLSSLYGKEQSGVYFYAFHATGLGYIGACVCLINRLKRGLRGKNITARMNQALSLAALDSYAGVTIYVLRYYGVRDQDVADWIILNETHFLNWARLYPDLFYNQSYISISQKSS